MKRAVVVVIVALCVGAGARAQEQGPAGAPPGAPGQGRAGMEGTPAQDFEKGASLLAAARKALGGEDRFKAVQRLEVRGRSARAMGNANVQGDFEIQIELPDKFRRKESMSQGDFGIDLLRVLNGTEANETVSSASTGGAIGGFDGGDGGGGGGGRGGRGRGNIAAMFGGAATQDPETRQQALASEMARLTIALLLTTTEPVAWVGVAESPDGRAEVLEFRTPDGVATRLLLAEKTSLPLMLSWTGVASQMGNFARGGGGFRGGQGGQGRRGGGPGAGQMADLQIYLSDYKNVSGMRLPHLIQSGANNETTEELVVRNYRINPSFRPDTFTQ